MVLICDFRQSKYSHSRMHTWNETFIRYQNETWKKCWECREIPTIADHDRKGHAFSSSFVEAVRDCLLVLCARVRRYCSLPENPLRGLLLVLLFDSLRTWNELSIYALCTCYNVWSRPQVTTKWSCGTSAEMRNASTASPLRWFTQLATWQGHSPMTPTGSYSWLSYYNPKVVPFGQRCI